MPKLKDYKVSDIKDAKYVNANDTKYEYNDLWNGYQDAHGVAEEREVSLQQFASIWMDEDSGSVLIIKLGDDRVVTILGNGTQIWI